MGICAGKNKQISLDLKNKSLINNKVENQNVDVEILDLSIDKKRLNDIDFETYLSTYKEKASLNDLKIILKYNVNNNYKFIDLDSRNVITIAILNDCSDEVIKYLISLKIDINSVDQNDLTSLHYAIQLLKFEIIKYIIESGFNFKIKNQSKISYLHHACQYSTKEVVQYLVELGLSLQDKDEQAWTPLHYACRYNNIDVVKYCYLKYLNDTNCCDETEIDELVSNEGETLLFLSVK